MVRFGAELQTVCSMCTEMCANGPSWRILVSVPAPLSIFCHSKGATSTRTGASWWRGRGLKGLAPNWGGGLDFRNLKDQLEKQRVRARAMHTTNRYEICMRTGDYFSVEHCAACRMLKSVSELSAARCLRNPQNLLHAIESPCQTKWIHFVDIDL